MNTLVCNCNTLPHREDCPVAPFFEDGITLDSEHGDDGTPFIVRCPRGCEFPQTQHAAGYDYSTTDGQTDEGDFPIVCPVCGYSDKRWTLAVISSQAEPEDDTDQPFIFVCPGCAEEQDRSDGNLDVWVERNVLKGVKEARVRGIWFSKGQIVDEYTELSIACPNCGYSYGEDPE